MDVLPRLKLLKVLTALTHTLLLFLLAMSFTAKGIYLNEACSGFELESPSISGLEPGRPVTTPSSVLTAAVT